MEDPHDLTIATYCQTFDTFIKRTPQEIHDLLKKWVDDFLGRLPSRGRILEIGSAFGRHARYMHAQNFTVLCTDIIPQALTRLSNEGFETAHYDFRDKPREDWVETFDGFFAHAVFLHATKEVFEQALWNIHHILKPGGVAAFSLKLGRGDEITSKKLNAPRYFKYYQPDELDQILKAYPFEIVSIRVVPIEDGWILATIKK